MRHKTVDGEFKQGSRLIYLAINSLQRLLGVILKEEKENSQEILIERFRMRLMA